MSISGELLVEMTQILGEIYFKTLRLLYSLLGLAKLTLIFLPSTSVPSSF